MIDENYRPNFVASHDVRLLCRILSACTVGQVVTYQELSLEIGKDIQTESRAALVSARRIVQRESGIVFGTIQSKGLKRLSDTEIVQTGSQTVVKLRHASRRGAERLAKADPLKVSLETRVQQNSYLSVLALMHSLTTEKQMKKLQERVEAAESRLPLQKTLDAFRDETEIPKAPKK